MPYIPLDCRFAPQPTAPAAARRSASAWLNDRGVPPHAVDDALIVISELVANGVLHGSNADDIRVRVDIEADQVIIDVTTAPAAAGTCPVPRGEPHETGRGLVMVAACCVDVEVARDPSGARRTSCRIVMAPEREARAARPAHVFAGGTRRPSDGGR